MDAEGGYYEEPRPTFNPWFMSTASGALKSIQTVSSLVVFACVVMIHVSFGGTYFVAFVSISTFTISLVLLIMYLFSLIQVASSINWQKYELIYDICCCVLYPICIVLMSYSASKWLTYAAPWAASAFFSFVCLVSFAVDAYLIWKTKKDSKTTEQYARSTATHTDV